jgi:hypothetical protein
LKTWPKNTASPPANIDIDETNFMEKVFANGDNLALSQQAISQGIINQEIKFNDTSLPIVSDIGELCNITSQYWDREQVMSEIQASIPDRFIDVGNYSSSGSLKFIDSWGKTSHVSISPDNDDPWASKFL